MSKIYISGVITLCKKCHIKIHSGEADVLE